MNTTRFPELSYERQSHGLWRIVDSADGSAIGPQYRTKAELLADLPRFADNYGCGDNCGLSHAYRITPLHNI